MSGFEPLALDRQTMNATAYDIYGPKEVSHFETLQTFETTVVFPLFEIDQLLQRQVQRLYLDIAVGDIWSCLLNIAAEDIWRHLGEKQTDQKRAT